MLFDFKCSNCERIATDIYMPFEHEEEDHPECCGTGMRKYFTSFPYVAWIDRQLLDGGFKAQHDGTVITSVKQNKEYMARHGLRLADDEYDAPTFESEKQERAAGQAAIDAITPTDDQMERMVYDGTMAQLNDMMESEID